MTSPRWEFPSDYVPRVILKLKRTPQKLPTDPGLLRTALLSRGLNLDSFAERFGTQSARRTRLENPEQIAALEEAVRQRFGKSIEYDTFVEIPVRGDVAKFVADLKENPRPDVEMVLVESEPAAPPDGWNYANLPHIQDATAGVGSRTAWNNTGPGAYSGMTGSGVAIADIEEGWNLTHAELGAITLVGHNHSSFEHGTRVLGLLGSQDRQSKIRGMAWESNLFAVSLWQFDEAGNPSFSRANAIRAACAQLAPGDILMLQTQRALNGKYVPAESDPLVFFEIQAAVARNITVIEAAGNDRVNVANSLQATESGAVIVTAASNAGAGWDRMWNYGNRIDCFAQGTGVPTIDPADPSKQSVLRDTSAATAIVAGAAAQLQSWMKSSTGQFLDAGDMKNQLTDPSNTPSIPNKAIGVMPDLLRIKTRLAARFAGQIASGSPGATGVSPAPGGGGGA